MSSFELKLLEINHLSKKDTEPSEMTERERLNMLEDCILEIADIIGGGTEE